MVLANTLTSLPTRLRSVSLPFFKFQIREVRGPTISGWSLNSPPQISTCSELNQSLIFSNSRGGSSDNSLPLAMIFTGLPVSIFGISSPAKFLIGAKSNR